jgi:ribonuclease P protein component
MRVGCRGVKLFALKNNLPHNRSCFTLSRNFGTAVERNRAKRLGREAYRLLQPRFSGGYDLVLLVYPDTAGEGHAKEAASNVVKAQKSGLALRTAQLEFLFSKAHLFKTP